jgi:4-amino-4-deoxy-L-arabinose transferase-like glycosyltransferase
MRRLSSFPLLWIVVAAVAVTAVDLGWRVLSTNDEARFAVLAQDILTRGDWLFPRINGAVYHNKPPLLAWLIALASWPLGYVTQLTAALPSAAAAVGMVLIVFVTGRTLFGTDAGRYAALMAVTTQGVFLHARLPMPDMLMALFVTASVAALWPMLRGRRGPYWVAFYGFAGLAFWAKGPAGLLPLAVGLACFAACERPAGWGALSPVRGLALLLALTAPWTLREALADSVAAREVLLSEYLSWYLPQRLTVASVVAPWQNAFGVLFPWVLVVPAAVAQAVRFLRGRGAEREGVLFLLVWAGVVFLLVCPSQQQRVRYYLPLAPPVVLLVGWWLAGVAVKRRPVSRMPWWAYGIAAGLLLIGAGAGLASRGLPSDLAISLPTPGEGLVAGGALGLMAVALFFGIRQNRLRRGWPMAWAASAVLVIVSYHGEVGRRNAESRYEPLAGAAVVAAWGVPELPWTFYLGRPVVAVNTADELRRALASEPAGVAIVKGSMVARLADDMAVTVRLRERLASREVAVVSLAQERASP